MFKLLQLERSTHRPGRWPMAFGEPRKPQTAAPQLAVTPSSLEEDFKRCHKDSSRAGCAPGTEQGPGKAHWLTSPKQRVRGAEVCFVFTHPVFSTRSWESKLTVDHRIEERRKRKCLRCTHFLHGKQQGLSWLALGAGPGHVVSSCPGFLPPQPAPHLPHGSLSE